MILLEDTNLKN